MILAKGKQWFGIAVIVIACGACAPRQMMEFNDRPIPASAQSLPLADIERTILQAGARHDWQITRIEDGRLSGKWTNENRNLVIDIVYSQKSYSITLASSQNMNQSGNLIDRRYNSFVRTLDADIQRRLSLSANQRPS